MSSRFSIKFKKRAIEKAPGRLEFSRQAGYIIAGDGLDGKTLSALYRRSGLYPHHIEQWKADFLTGDISANISGNISFGRKTRSSENARLRKENKALKKELNRPCIRKDKALAETAALLVLKKKWWHSGTGRTRTIDHDRGLPGKIVPRLADQGKYIASESTFYRVLKAVAQLNYRHRSKPARKVATMLATLHYLGVIPSFSRPSVSNDNPIRRSLPEP